MVTVSPTCLASWFVNTRVIDDYYTTVTPIKLEVDVLVWPIIVLATLTGNGMKIFVNVVLIHNLSPQQGFNDIFERKKADGFSIAINNNKKMASSSDESGERMLERIFLMNIEDTLLHDLLGRRRLFVIERQKISQVQNPHDMI